MKRSKILITLMVVCLMSASALAQGYHFIYIQADGQQPFYLKYNGKNYSSSSIGYLILPKLSDGSFTVQIGFPKDVYPEQAFNLSVAGKDYGYALKSFADKGWGLFNFQTTDVVMNVNAAAAQAAPAQTVVTNTSNPFGNMLADAINDSTLNQQRVAPGNNTAKTTAPVAAKDTAATAVSEPVDNSAPASQPYSTQAAVDSLVKVYSNSGNASVKNATADTVTGIVKSSENTTSSGTDLTFVDNSGKDTIHAFIPSADTVGAAKKTEAAEADKNKAGNPFFNGSNSNTTTAQQPRFVDSASSAGIIANTITNNNCQKMISSYDIEKLRKKIAKSDSQDEILAAIKKALRDKCMTTEQVKDFGNLFSSDENRYNFYDSVYPFVSDSFNFPQLQSTLIDTYYRNRFKALLR